MGKCVYSQLNSENLDEGLEAVNRAVAHFPTFLPAIVEKSKVKRGSLSFWLRRLAWKERCGVTQPAFPHLQPPFLQQILLALGDWDGAAEAVTRCFALDPDCIEAHHQSILQTLAKQGNYERAAGQLGQLIAALDKTEPNNHAVFFKVCFPATAPKPG